MKRTPKLLLMILLLLVLVSMCLIVRSCDEEVEDEPEVTTLYDASDIDGDTVSALIVKNENGDFSFEKSGDSWIIADAPTLEIQSDVVAQLAQSMIDVTGTNRIENVSDLSQYGLDEPRITVTVTDKNGEETYRFGNYNSMISAYYFCSEQNPTYVFTVESSVCESFEFAVSEILTLSFPQPPEADSIKSVEFKTDDSDIVYTAISEFLYNDEDQVTDDNPSGAVYSHTATKTAGGKTVDYSYADMYRLCEAVAAIMPSGDYLYTEADNETYFPSYVTVTITYIVQEALDADNAAGGYIETEKTLTLYLSGSDEGDLFAKPDAQKPLIYKLTENEIREFSK